VVIRVCHRLNLIRDKCIICQVFTPELLIEMRNVSKNSLIEAMEARRYGLFFLE
jgi:hypothetical protein